MGFSFKFRARACLSLLLVVVNSYNINTLAQTSSCGTQNTIDFLPSGHVLASVDSSYQHLVYEIANNSVNPATYSTYYVDMGADGLPGTADDAPPFLLFTQNRPAKPKVNFLGLVAFESQYMAPSMGVNNDVTLAVCYWSICPSQIYLAVQTVRNNAPGLLGALIAPDGGFGGHKWTFYELVYARRTINPATAGVGSAAGVLMSYDFVADSDLIYNITPNNNPQGGAVYRIQNQDDYGNLTSVNLDITGFLNLTYKYYFFDKSTGQMNLLETSNDNKNFDVFSVYQVDQNSKLLFRAVPESSGFSSDIVFEHTNTGLFSAQPSQRHAVPVQNDGRTQEWPFVVNNLSGSGHTMGFYTRGNGADRAITLYDFDAQTLQLTRPRAWNAQGSRANHYFNGWVFGDALVTNPATGTLQKAVVSADCR